MKESHPTLRTYAIGFVSCLILTSLAFLFAAKHVMTDHLWPPHPAILYILLGLAFIQFVVQLIFFLHLSFNPAQRWNVVIFASTISIVLILVVGSLWIMYHLNYNMTPNQMDMYNIKND